MAELYLRHFVPDIDAVRISQWVLDSDYKNFFRGQLIPPSFEDCWNYAKWAGVTVFMVQRKEDGQEETAGMVTLSNFDLRTRSVHASGLCDKKYQGRKEVVKVMAVLLKYVFEVLGFNKVITMVVDEFLIDYYKKHGFHYEGKHLRDSFLDGKWLDSHRLCIFAEDYQVLKNGI